MTDTLTPFQSNYLYLKKNLLNLVLVDIPFWNRTLCALNAARDGLLQTRHAEVLKSDTSVNSSSSFVISLRVSTWRFLMWRYHRPKWSPLVSSLYATAPSTGNEPNPPPKLSQLKFVEKRVKRPKKKTFYILIWWILKSFLSSPNYHPITRRSICFCLKR